MNSSNKTPFGHAAVCGLALLACSLAGCQSISTVAERDDDPDVALGYLPRDAARPRRAKASEDPDFGSDALVRRPRFPRAVGEDVRRDESDRLMAAASAPRLTPVPRKERTTAVSDYSGGARRASPDVREYPRRAIDEDDDEDRFRIVRASRLADDADAALGDDGPAPPPPPTRDRPGRAALRDANRDGADRADTDRDLPRKPESDEPKRSTTPGRAAIDDVDLAVGTLGQSWPIDLPTALRLGNGSNLQVRMARERINVARARVTAAQALWLPTLTAGATYVHHTDMIQRANGEVFNADRNSFFLGGGPTANVDLADAFYEPLVQKQFLRADAAGARAVRNETLVRVSDAWFDLVAAEAALEIARETRANASSLARLTQEQAREEVGLKSDAERAATEVGSRAQQVVLAQERVTVSSAQLAQLLHLDPQTRLVPAEIRVLPIDLVEDHDGLPRLVAHALRHRPELAEHQALLCAAVQRLNQATCGPFLPSVIVTYSRGRFGGGPHDKFDHWGDRDDFTVGPVWELRNLGFGELAARRARQSELSMARMRSLQMADRVATEVVTAHQVVTARRKQLDIAGRTVESARRSLELNLTRIRGGAGLPIEALQSIQALERAQADYLMAVTNYNKAQFRLVGALGDTPYARDIPYRETPYETPRIPPQPKD